MPSKSSDRGQRYRSTTTISRSSFQDLRIFGTQPRSCQLRPNSTTSPTATHIYSIRVSEVWLPHQMIWSAVPKRDTWLVSVSWPVPRLGVGRAIVKTCGSRVLGGCRWDLVVGSFDQESVDEGRSGANEGDEMGCVDRAPAGLR